MGVVLSPVQYMLAAFVSIKRHMQDIGVGLMPLNLFLMEVLLANTTCIDCKYCQQVLLERECMAQPNTTTPYFDCYNL
jgi:hypothetical protein